MVGKKVVHHLMMSAKDAHYVGGLVNGARIVNQWGDVGTELMVCFRLVVSVYARQQRRIKEAAFPPTHIVLSGMRSVMP